MAIQPIDYSSAGLQALQGGLQTGLGLREASMRQQLFDQQLAAQEKQQQFGVALKSAWESGDNKAMVGLLASNPEQLQTIQGLMGFRDQRQRQAIGNVASQLTAALDSGNVQGAADAIQSNAEALQAMGQDPAALLQQLQQDPTALRKGAYSLMLLTMSPDQVMAHKQKLEDQQLRRDQMQVQLRGQDITVRGQDMSAGTAAADRMARAELKAADLDMKLKELGMKPTLDAKDIKGINSDISSFKKDADVMYGAATDLQTIRENATPAAQLAAIFKFMKALDPTSVVREGEQVMLQKTGGIYDSVGNYVSRLNNGSRLNADQLKDLANTAKRLANSSASTVNKSIDDYLSTYGENLSEGQKRLFTRRKVKTFDVAAPAVDDVNEGSRYRTDLNPGSATTSSVSEMSDEQLTKLLGL